MNAPLTREFRLSVRKGLGVCCDADGAFVGAVPLLKRTNDEWTSRDSEELSESLSEAYGLPVDVSPKTKALAAVARALNEGNVARAQMTTLFAHFPDPPRLAKRAPSRDEIIGLAQALDWAGLLKINSNHYPAKAPGGKGGQFAPKDADTNPDAQNDVPDAPNNSTDLPREGRQAARAVRTATQAAQEAAERQAARGATTAAAEAAEQAAEGQASRAATIAAVKEAAVSEEKAVIRVAARRALRAAALDALESAGKKLVLSEIPIIGPLADLATVYDVYRFAQDFVKLREAINAATRFVNEGAHTLAQLRMSNDRLVFSSYRQFLKIEAVDDFEKRFGSAGDGMQYHHIIEEGSGVASNLVENTDNVVRIPAILHEAINARYATKSADYGGLTLREWLKSQPVEVKRAEGIKVLREFGIIVD